MNNAPVKRLRTPLPLHKMTDKTPRNDTKRYQVIPMTTPMADIPPEVDGKIFQYGKSGGCMTNDSGVANEIVAKYGKENVEIWELNDNFHPADKGHKYKFGNADLPWKKDNPRYNEYGVRIDTPEEEENALQEQEAARVDAHT